MIRTQRLSFAALSLTFAIVGGSAFAAPKVEIANLSSPPLLLRQGAGFAQTVTADIASHELAGTVEFRVGGVSTAVELKEGPQTLSALAPVVSASKTVGVSLVRGGVVLAAAEVELKPVRQREIRIIHQTHLDIGFTHKQEEVLQVQVGNLRDALRFVEETKDYPEEAQFRFHPEGMWAVEEFMRSATDAEKATFLDACRAGKIHLDGLRQQLQVRDTRPGHHDAHRPAVGLDHHAAFRAWFAAICRVSADVIPPNRAFCRAPSTACQVQSTPPRSAHAVTRSTQICSKTPASTQRCIVRCTELSSGNCSGNWFHWQPVRNT